MDSDDNIEILKRKLSTKDIYNFLNRNEKIDKIVCSEGAYNHLPKRALKALNKMGVEIEVVKLSRGQKPSTDVEKIRELMKLPAQEISTKTQIPLRTVYYHLKKIRKSLSLDKLSKLRRLGSSDF